MIWKFSKMKHSKLLKEMPGIKRFCRVSLESKRWKDLTEQWTLECVSLGESFSKHKTRTFDSLAMLAEAPQDARSGVFALHSNGRYQAICLVNLCYTPEPITPVLRVHHIIPAPKMKLDESISLYDYHSMLAAMFKGIWDLSNNEMECHSLRLSLQIVCMDLRSRWRGVKHFPVEDAETIAGSCRDTWLRRLYNAAGNPSTGCAGC